MEQTKKDAKNGAKNIKNDVSVTPLQKFFNDRLVKSGLRQKKIIHLNTMVENNEKSHLLHTRNLSKEVHEANLYRQTDEFKTSCQVFGVTFANIEEFAKTCYNMSRRWFFDLKKIGALSDKEFTDYVTNLDEKRAKGEKVSYSYKELIKHIGGDTEKSDKKPTKAKAKKLFNATLLGDTPKQVIISDDKKIEKGSVSDALAQILFLMQVCEIEISTIETALSQK